MFHCVSLLFIIHYSFVVQVITTLTILVVIVNWLSKITNKRHVMDYSRKEVCTSISIIYALLHCYLNNYQKTKNKYTGHYIKNTFSLKKITFDK